MNDTQIVVQLIATIHSRYPNGPVVPAFALPREIDYSRLDLATRTTPVCVELDKRRLSRVVDDVGEIMGFESLDE